MHYVLVHQRAKKEKYNRPRTSIWEIASPVYWPVITLCTVYLCIKEKRRNTIGLEPQFGRCKISLDNLEIQINKGKLAKISTIYHGNHLPGFLVFILL